MIHDIFSKKSRFFRNEHIQIFIEEYQANTDNDYLVNKYLIPIFKEMLIYHEKVNISGKTLVKECALLIIIPIIKFVIVPLLF